MGELWRRDRGEGANASSPDKRSVRAGSPQHGPASGGRPRGGKSTSSHKKSSEKDRRRAPALEEKNLSPLVGKGMSALEGEEVSALGVEQEVLALGTKESPVSGKKEVSSAETLSAALCK